MREVGVEYDILLAEFKAILKKSKLKFTSQRETLLKTLYETSEHLTPEQLCDRLKMRSNGANVGIATVYRTLNLLEDAGFVTSISFGTAGKKIELANKPHHDHMICKKCGEIIEFRDEGIEKAQVLIAEAHGFRLTGHIQQLYGFCKKCSAEN